MNSSSAKLNIFLRVAGNLTLLLPRIVWNMIDFSVYRKMDECCNFCILTILVLCCYLCQEYRGPYAQICKTFVFFVILFMLM